MANKLNCSQSSASKTFPFTELSPKATSSIFGSLPLAELPVVSRVSQFFNRLTEQDPRLIYSHANKTVAKKLFSAERPSQKIPLELPIDVHQKDLLDYTPLHDAVKSGQPALVAALLAKRADPYAKDWRGGTPLHFACEEVNPNPSIIRYLLQQGANPLAQDSRGVTPLEEAIERSSYSRKTILTPVILEMIEGCKNGLDIKNEEGETLLHSACFAENFKVVQSLVKRGLDPTLENKEGKSAFSMLLDSFDLVMGGKEIMEFMAEMLEQHPSLASQKNYRGDTLLHIACEYRDTKIMKKFLKEKTDWFVQNTRGGTPYGMLLDKLEDLTLSKEDRIALCCYAVLLIVDHPGIDLNMKNGSGKTLLHLAVQLKNPILISFLLQRTADPFVQDNLGNTPLEYSAIDYIDSFFVTDDVLLRQKIVLSYMSNLFGLGGKFKIGPWTFCGEGVPSDSAARFFAAVMNAFFSSPAFESLKTTYPELKDIDFTGVLEALNRLPSNFERSAQELATRIQQGEYGQIEALLTSWAFPDGWHAAGVVFFGKYLFAKINRGGQSGVKTGIEFYTITRPDKIEESIEWMRKHGAEKNGWSYFATGIDETLGLVFIAHYPLSKQKVGNCPVAACHGILRALVAPIIQDRKLTDIVSKTAVAYELEDGIKSGLMIEPRNVPFLQAVNDKIERASPNSRLGKFKLVSFALLQVRDFLRAADQASSSDKT